MDINEIFKPYGEIDFAKADDLLVGKWLRSSNRYFLCQRVSVVGPIGTFLDKNLKYNNRCGVFSFHHLSKWEVVTDEAELNTCEKAILIQKIIK